MEVEEDDNFTYETIQSQNNISQPKCNYKRNIIKEK